MKKEIYFYWGNQPMSFMRYMTIKSFSHFNPEWNINLIINSVEKKVHDWGTAEKQDDKFYTGPDYRLKLFEIKRLNILSLENILKLKIENISNIHLKDILNWYLLSSRSCVVADMDILFCESIEKTKGIDWDANVNICNYDFFNNYMPISMIVSRLTEKGKNPFFEEVFKNSIKNYNPQIYESCGSNSIGYPSLYAVKDKFTNLKIHKMDEDVVFPFVKANIHNCVTFMFERNNYHLLSENVAGIHWYGGNPMAQEFNNAVNDTNYKDFNNTISTILKKILG